MIINETYFKKYSPIPLNYNMTEIKNYIPVATKIWVIPVIGRNLYNELEQQVKENKVSEANATLLTDGGLWQYLSFATVLEALPMVWASVTEIGIVKGHSENSESLTLKDLTLVQQHLRNQVEFLKDSVKRFICEHYMSFPLADVCGCGCSCCQENNAKLNKPNPQAQIWSTNRKCTDLK